jgi:catechol 2,3-dioxygenase-like lactoylglutathione lyase family enzyme
MRLKANRILETSLYASDLPAAENFYLQLLGLEPSSRVAGRHLFYKIGDGMLLIFNPDKSGEAGGEVPQHGARGPGHIAFAVLETELDDWRKQLARQRVEIETEIAWPTGGYSLYFRDPAGNSIELATPQTWGIEYEQRRADLEGGGLSDLSDD